MKALLKSPFPWFGGKSRAADLIWSRLGDVPNYVEPFAGSLATLLLRPHEPRAETINDLDCYVSNFWRALKMDPEAVALHADWPINEADLHARHLWLVQQKDFRERMMSDPGFYDVKVAGWWCWGICQWIGGGWCSERSFELNRPEWNARPQLKSGLGVHAKMPDTQSNCGVHRKRMVLGRGGRGVNTAQKRPMLKAVLPGVHKQLKRTMPTLGGDGSGSGRGVHRWGRPELLEWFYGLAGRLRMVRVTCGDWKRILGPSPTTHIGVTGVLLDPPYGEAANRYFRSNTQIYSQDSLTVAEDVRQWAVEQGDNPKLRIALCGYEGEHDMPDSWDCVAWKAGGGYARAAGKDNAKKERIWFSPHCLASERETTSSLL